MMELPPSNIGKRLRKVLTCYLGNVGSGKTEAMVLYCVDHHQDRRILYLVPDHENANEVVTRLESKGIKVFHFGDKNMILVGEGEDDIPFYQQLEGRRYGH